MAIRGTAHRRLLRGMSRTTRFQSKPPANSMVSPSIPVRWKWMKPVQRHCAPRPHELLATDSRHGVQAYHGGGGHIHDDGERAFYARQTMNLAAETRRLIE